MKGSSAANRAKATSNGIKRVLQKDSTKDEWKSRIQTSLKGNSGKNDRIKAPDFW